MSAEPKHIAVAVVTQDPERVGEALRAAVGLGLRGDQVTVVFAEPGARAAAASEPAAVKALATLEALGRPIADAGALAEVLARADAAEVWT